MDEVGFFTTLWMAIAILQSSLLFYSAHQLRRWKSLVEGQQILIEELLREQAKLLHPRLIKGVK